MLIQPRSPVIFALSLVALLACSQSLSLRPSPAIAGNAPLPETHVATLVTDGSFVHDAGNLRVNITNFGLIGSKPGSKLPFSHAPSAEWPAGSEMEHLWAAGLWVGALKNGVPFVSTGQFESELMATADPLDVMHDLEPTARGNARYPHPSYDDDWDGLEDEDPVNFRDDDGDGIADEDGAFIGNQHFRCELRDDTPLARQLYPDHVPLGLVVAQESFQWSDPRVDDFVGLRYTITNSGNELLSDVYLGFFVDSDVGPRALATRGEDDSVDFYRGAEASRGARVAFDVAMVHDCGDAPGWIGVVPLGHSTDLMGRRAPEVFSLRGVHFIRGGLPFDGGGDPTNDVERYEILARDSLDPAPVSCELPADYRVLVSVGPFPLLEPGASVELDLALVVGEGREGLIGNATEAALVYHDAYFDRDKNPRTGIKGRETRICLGDLVEGGNRHSPSLSLLMDPLFQRTQDCLVVTETALPRPIAPRDLDEDGCIYVNADCEIESKRGSFRCDEEGTIHPDWLVGCTGLGGREHHVPWYFSDPVVVGAPSVSTEGLTIQLRATPNPFNPRVVLRYVLPEPGAALLTIHDARGREIRRWVGERRSGGLHETLWDGRDDRGIAMASGVYYARLESRGVWTSTRLVLLR